MTHTITTNFLTRAVAAFPSIDATHTNAYTAFIDGLVDQGICTDTAWGPFDLLYIRATQDELLARLNLPNATYDSVNVNAMAFTADQGYTTQNAAGSSTSFIPSSASSPNYAQNSALIGVYVRNNRTAGDRVTEAGVYDGTNDTEVSPWWNDNIQYFPLNEAGTGDGAASIVWGNWIVSRTGSTTITIYHNGASFVTDASASLAVPTKEVYFENINNNGSFGASASVNEQIAAGFLGSSLTASQAAIFDNLLNTFMAAVGANVYPVITPITWVPPQQNDFGLSRQFRMIKTGQ